MKKIFFFIVLLFISSIIYSQSIVVKENASKVSSIKTVIPSDKTLLVFESNLDLEFESSMEYLDKVKKEASTYQFFITRRTCVITIKSTKLGNLVSVPFGQLNEGSYPTLKKGEIKYFEISQEDRLVTYDNTESYRSEGASDNQMKYEKEALLILYIDPTELDLDIKSSVNITEVIRDPKDPARMLIYVKPENQNISIADKLTQAKTILIVNDIKVKDVKYYRISLPGYLMKKFLLKKDVDFTDKRDGKVYKIADIGNQTWMTENLAYKPDTSHYYFWDYDNKKEEIRKYGYLYDISTRLAVCPEGWRLPISSEFGALLTFCGGQGESASIALGKNGSSGFNALSGGSAFGFGINNVTGKSKIIGAGENGGYWTSSMSGCLRPDVLYFSPNEGSEIGPCSYPGYSIRCIKRKVKIPQIDYVSIPAGTYNMGSPENDTWRDEDETQHVVDIAPFKMSRHEITFDQYDAFCDETGKEKPQDNGWGRGDRPVINITWNDANEFAAWVGGQLPTEAEWEYACRAGTKTAFNVGDTITKKQANYSNVKTMPVGSFQPNSWGLYDMHGNVSEFCKDMYDNYDTDRQKNPCIYKSDLSYQNHIVRGGDFSDKYWYSCGSARRNSTNCESTHKTMGFRIVIDN